MLGAQLVDGGGEVDTGTRAVSLAANGGEHGSFFTGEVRTEIGGDLGEQAADTGEFGVVVPVDADDFGGEGGQSWELGVQEGVMGGLDSIREPS